jgi:hypothetical protein
MARSTPSPVTAPGTAIDAVPGRWLAFACCVALRPAPDSFSLVWDFRDETSAVAFSSQLSALSVLELELPADS